MVVLLGMYCSGRRGQSERGRGRGQRRRGKMEVVIAMQAPYGLMGGLTRTGRWTLGREREACPGESNFWSYAATLS